MKGQGQTWASQGRVLRIPSKQARTGRGESPGPMSCSCCQEFRQAPKSNKGGNRAKSKVVLQTQVPKDLGS